MLWPIVRARRERFRSMRCASQVHAAALSRRKPQSTWDSRPCELLLLPAQQTEPLTAIFSSLRTSCMCTPAAPRIELARAKLSECAASSAFARTSTLRWCAIATRSTRQYLIQLLYLNWDHLYLISSPGRDRLAIHARREHGYLRPVRLSRPRRRLAIVM